ncbi:hypothetical protein EYF80_053205 [Liparis tanakae]|uniref:Uncharacterized protein n=1 Tax=Liparis tanakae TaxID=230148 RepID=A0A4Z2F628_9TELE|nr:hypothetical protein EYF80_053205 [Liparis tanakae]
MTPLSFSKASMLMCSFLEFRKSRTTLITSASLTPIVSSAVMVGRLISPSLGVKPDERLVLMHTPTAEPLVTVYRRSGAAAGRNTALTLRTPVHLHRSCCCKGDARRGSGAPHLSVCAAVQSLLLFFLLFLFFLLLPAVSTCDTL